MLYTGDKQSSTIFCCLCVCLLGIGDTRPNLSFFNIYRCKYLSCLTRAPVVIAMAQSHDVQYVRQWSDEICKFANLPPFTLTHYSLVWRYTCAKCLDVLVFTNLGCRAKWNYAAAGGGSISKALATHSSGSLMRPGYWRASPHYKIHRPYTFSQHGISLVLTIMAQSPGVLDSRGQSSLESRPEWQDLSVLMLGIYNYTQCLRRKLKTLCCWMVGHHFLWRNFACRLAL